MSITAGKMAKKLTNVAKTGAKSNIEKEKVNRLEPIVLMALEDDEIKMVRVSVRKDSHLHSALESCLKHYGAHTYTFVKEGEGTDFPEALLMANGDFSLLASEDKYQVLTLQTVIKGIPSIFTSTALVESDIKGRTVGTWVDEVLDENAKFYVLEW